MSEPSSFIRDFSTEPTYTNIEDSESNLLVSQLGRESVYSEFQKETPAFIVHDSYSPK